MSEAIMKKAAEELLKIADEIEQEAATVTQFVCESCNHTASLASINAKRKTAAQEVGENVTVSDITVNDKIQCPACDGVMAYKATEASEAYYFDPEKKADDKPGETEDEKAEKEEDKKAAGHSEETETPEDEAKETLDVQKKERAQGKHASIDYDSLKRYTK
jgi:Mg-chelatase subunit ChlI